MGVFANNSITDAGRILEGELKMGAVFTPTRIVMGSGFLPSGTTARTIKDVISPVISLQINKKNMSNNGMVVIGGVYSNAEIQSDFYFRELALYAKAVKSDGSATDEILYSYGNAGNAADLMPAYTSGTAVERQIDLATYVGIDIKVDLTIESGVYVTQKQLEDALNGNENVQQILNAHIEDKQNPHNVTATQVGAIPTSQKGVADGVASLDSNGKVPESQLPELDFIPNDEKGQPNGVMPLNSDGKADAKYLPKMDFYTKAETLANNTKTLFGLDASAVPDAVFNKLSRLDNKLADEYFWDVCKNVTNFYDSKLYGYVYLSSGKGTGAETQTIYYSTEIEYSEGRVKLKNPQAVEVSYDNMPSADLLNGKYCICPQDKQNEPISTKVYRVVNISEIKRGADFSNTSKRYVIMFGTLYEQQAYTSLEHVKYISSPNRHPELPVGFENLFLGKLGEKATIKTGQYVGTGTYGESNPNSLSFEFEPKVLILVDTSTKELIISARQSNGFIFFDSYGNVRGKPFTWDKNKIQWFDRNYASEQFNSLGKFYYYIVIG